MSYKVDLTRTLSTQFVCLRCDNRGAHVEKLTMRRTNLFKSKKRLLSASCHHCGYTELFNPSMLENPKGSNFIDGVLSGVAMQPLPQSGGGGFMGI